jgi:hypothetical protein
MKVYTKKQMPAYELTYVKSRKCDLCGLETKGSDWQTGLWEVNETEITIAIKQKEGENYPEGGSGTEHEIDLCPNCFKNKLVPWLNSQGADIKQKEWDW